MPAWIRAFLSSISDSIGVAWRAPESGIGLSLQTISGIVVNAFAEHGENFDRNAHLVG